MFKGNFKPKKNILTTLISPKEHVRLAEEVYKPIYRHRPDLYNKLTNSNQIPVEVY